MRQLTLNQAVVTVTVAALLPIIAFGVTQSMSDRQYAMALSRSRLVEGALATASAQREAFAVVESLLGNLSHDPSVIEATPGCQKALQRGLLGQSAVLNLGRASADGRVRCSALSFSGPISNNGQAWWEQGIRDPGLTISAPTYGRITRRSVLVAMQPLTTPAGAFDGAVTAAIDAAWVKKILVTRTMSENSVVAIVDRRGHALFSTRPIDGHNFKLDGPAGSVAQTASDGTSPLLYAVAPLFKKQLFVVYAEPVATMLSPLRAQFRLTFLMPILTILATSLAIWIAMNRYVVQWLRRLSTVATQIAQGRYTQSPDAFARAPYEIARLGETLGTMAQSISERDSALRTSAAQNHAMAREVNHRVKNNLQMVMSLLDLQSLRLSDVAARNVLTQTRLRMGAIALVHRILYDFGEQSDFGVVDMDRLVEELSAQLRNAQLGGVTLESDVAIGMISVDVAMPISLFMVEAVTNAYRHGFGDSRAGTIRVRLNGNETAGELTVSDNGTGFREAAPPSAIGTQLMEAYAQQLNGVFAITETPGGGVTVKLSYSAR